ncbi:MAG: proton-conducting transporter membrane subunit, partial [Desulfobulbaceae bacterium]|nr:proton-conducting transporter membrane subunit [Desulfobulbaceae bacterium]
LWFDIFPNVDLLVTSFFAVCGAGAIFWGGVQALRQDGLKMLVAYSTVGQIGYFFLIFSLIPMASDNGARMGVIYFVLAHGCAKGAMFLAVGSLVLQAGHDQLARLESIGQQVPVAGFAFGMAGISLMGLPPSGGFIAKYQFLSVAFQQGQWWLVGVIFAGSLLTAAYVYKVVSYINRPSANPPHSSINVSDGSQWWAFFLALVAMLLGFTGPLVSRFMEING